MSPRSTDGESITITNTNLEIWGGTGVTYPHFSVCMQCAPLQLTELSFFLLKVPFEDVSHPLHFFSASYVTADYHRQVSKPNSTLSTLKMLLVKIKTRFNKSKEFLSSLKKLVYKST